MHPFIFAVAVVWFLGACTVPPIPYAESHWHDCVRTERGCIR